MDDMKLSKTIAQKIVKEMMSVLPYNINVMNEHGIIIGSGEQNRIGSVHQASLNVIALKHSVEIFEESEQMKPGINEPILVDDQVIGVIGITGHPDVVRPFGQIVRVTAALLIEQSKLDQEKHNSRLNRQKFYLELSQKTKYDPYFMEKARTYDMDLSKLCRVIIVEGELSPSERKSIHYKYPHYVETDHQILFFLSNTRDSELLVEELKTKENVTKIAVGTKEAIASASYEKAELALEVGGKIRPSCQVYTYDNLRLLINISHRNKEFFVEAISNLDKAGNRLELIQTLQVYIEENGDSNHTANRLNIHRNTLAYRLERIHQLTGRNPKNLIELFELLCGLAWK